MNWAQMGNMAGLGNATGSMLGLPKNQMNSRAGDWWDNARGYAGYIPGPQQPFVQGFHAIGSFGENTIGLPEFFDPAGELISSFQKDPKTGKRNWGRIGANLLGGSVGSFLWNQMNQPEKRGGVAGMLLGGNRNNKNVNNYFKYGTNMNQYGYGSDLPQKNMGGLLSMLSPGHKMMKGIQGAIQGQGLGGVAKAFAPGMGAGITQNLMGGQQQPQQQPLGQIIGAGGYSPQGQNMMPGNYGNLQAMGQGRGAGYPGPPPPGMYAMGGKLPQHNWGDVIGKVGKAAGDWASSSDRDWGKIAGNTLTAAGLLSALGQGRRRRQQGGNRSNRMMDAMPPDSRMRMMNDMMGMMDMRYNNPRPGYGRFQAPTTSYAHWTPDMFNSQMGYMPTQYDYDDRGRGRGRGLANTLGILGLLGGAGYGGYKLWDNYKNRDKKERDNYEEMKLQGTPLLDGIYSNDDIPDIQLAKYGGNLSQHGYGKMPQYGLGDAIKRNWNTVKGNAQQLGNSAQQASGWLGNQAQAAGSGIQNTLQNTQQTFQNAGIPQGLQSGMQGMQNDMQQGMQNMGNKMQAGAQNTGNAMQRGMGNLGENMQHKWQNLHDGTTATNFNTSMGQLGSAVGNVGNMAGNAVGTIGGLPAGFHSGMHGGMAQGIGNATGLDINPSGQSSLQSLAEMSQGQPGQPGQGQPGQAGADGQPGADGQAGGANWDNYWNSYWQNNPHSYAFQGANQSNPYGNYSPYGQPMGGYPMGGGYNQGGGQNYGGMGYNQPYGQGGWNNQYNPQGGYQMNYYKHGGTIQAPEKKKLYRDISDAEIEGKETIVTIPEKGQEYAAAANPSHKLKMTSDYTADAVGPDHARSSSNKEAGIPIIGGQGSFVASKRTKVSDSILAEANSLLPKGASNFS